MALPTMLIAYDADLNVVATLDYLVLYDARGDPTGIADFAAHEAAGRQMTDVWVVEDAAGSKTWPEWLGMRTHDFRVELQGPAGAKHISALIHRTSGHRRERATVEAAITERIAAAGARREAADIRDLVGGPGRPLLIDDEGRTVVRSGGPRDVPRLGGLLEGGSVDQVGGIGPKAVGIDGSRQRDGNK